MPGKTITNEQGAYRKGINLQRYDVNGPVGNVFYVSSTAANAANNAGGGLSPDAPLATLAYALTLCVNDNDDTIILLPNHVEVIPVAGATWAVKGVTVVGIGRGPAKPLITFNATASQVIISANNFTLRNVQVQVSITSVVSLFSITGNFVTFDGVSFYETAAKQALQFAVVTGTDFEMARCRHWQLTAGASAQSWIQLNGSDRAYIHDNWLYLTLFDSATSFVIQSVTTAPKGVQIDHNRIVMTGYVANLVSAIKLLNGTLGLVCDNFIASNVAAITTPNTIGNAAFGSQNFVGHSPTTSGILEPVADA